MDFNTSTRSKSQPVQRNNYKVLYDPELGIKENLGRKIIYRFNGVSKPPLVVRDPRLKNPIYARGIPKSGRPFLKSLQTINYDYNENSLGPEPPTQVFVSNISPLVTSEQLRYHFKSFGEVFDLDLKLNPYTGTSLGLCCISFDKRSSISVAAHSAKIAVQQANGLRFSGKPLSVVLDRDGSLCEEAFKKALNAVEKQFQEETLQKQRFEREDESSRQKLSAAMNEDVPPWRQPSKNSQTLSNGDLQHSKVQNVDQKSGFLTSSETDVPKNINDYIYLLIDDRFVPPDRVYYTDIKHHFRKFLYEKIYMNKDGFYITFNNYREASNCYRALDRTYVQNCRIKLKFHDIPSRTKEDGKKSAVRRVVLPPEEAYAEATSVVLRDLEAALLRDVKSKIIGPAIFKYLHSMPKPSVKEELQENLLVSSTSVPDVPLKIESTVGKLPSLPKFKKRVDSGKMNLSAGSKTKSKLQRRRRRRHEARPLHYQLNQMYNSSASEAESDQELLLSSEDERVERGKIGSIKSVKSDEATPVFSDTSDENDDFLGKFHRFRTKSKISKKKYEKMEVDYTSSSETESDASILSPSAAIPKSGSAIKDELISPKKEIDEVLALAPKWRINEFDETGSVYYGALPYNYPEDDVLLDLDGLQYLVKNDEDYSYLQEALKDEPLMDINDPNFWAYERKSCKFKNGDVKYGDTAILPEPKGYFRSNTSGSAKSEGYYIIPTTEKSLYLPLRNRSTIDTISHSTSRITSRMNRVNNRRLAAGVEKSQLPAEADLLRFNALKARKKQLHFGPSRIHTLGLFAMENIDKNDMVIEYIGEIIRQRVADNREKNYVREGIGDSYLFRIDEDVIVDATKKGNIARFINHSCAPNCIARIIRVEGKRKIVIYADRDIMHGEELTYDYKFPEEADKIPCLCGAPTCRGYLN